jgi:hypothetical protein
VCWGGDRTCRPFPTPLFSLVALFLRCAPDKFSLTKPNTSRKIGMPASLRSEGVRVHPGMPFGFAPESAFGFDGILIVCVEAVTLPFECWEKPCSIIWTSGMKIPSRSCGPRIQT